MTNAEMFQDVFGRFPYLPCEDGYYIDAKLQDRQWWDMPFRDVQPMKWIPVTERLPEEYKNVLCYYEYFRYGDFNCMFRTIDRGYYGNGIWGGEAGQGHLNKVLAWMPLPEPPKDGET